MKPSVTGVSQRLSRPTPSGQPVECRADRITGTSARQAAIRPQNILSPAPTVTTASICRRRIKCCKRIMTRTSYFECNSRLCTGISRANMSPSGPGSFKQQISGQNRWRSMRRTRLTNSVSAPPTGMLVMANRTRSGPRSPAPLVSRGEVVICFAFLFWNTYSSAVHPYPIPLPHEGVVLEPFLRPMPLDVSCPVSAGDSHNAWQLRAAHPVRPHQKSTRG